MKKFIHTDSTLWTLSEKNSRCSIPPETRPIMFSNYAYIQSENQVPTRFPSITGISCLFGNFG